MPRISANTANGLPPPPTEKTGWPWRAVDHAATDAPEQTDWPRISIVTPSYNQGRFIEQTIRSVLMQEYANLEYIVMDGGSSDETGSILGKYDGLLSYWQSRADDGQADALRQGFQLSRGDILAWINADDYYEPHALQQIAGYFRAHPDVAFVSGDVNLVDEQGRFMRKIYALRPSHFFAANMGAHGWPQQGCFWRRSAYEAAGGINPAYHFCMDLDLFTRLVKSGHGRRLPGPAIANFRQHPASKTATQQEILHQEKARVIGAYGHPFWSSKPAVVGALWWVYRKQAAARLRLGRLKTWAVE